VIGLFVPARPAPGPPPRAPRKVPLPAMLRPPPTLAFLRRLRKPPKSLLLDSQHLNARPSQTGHRHQVPLLLWLLPLPCRARLKRGDRANHRTTNDTDIPSNSQPERTIMLQVSNHTASNNNTMHHSNDDTILLIMRMSTSTLSNQQHKDRSSRYKFHNSLRRLCTSNSNSNSHHS
jgi:hypothetical protein